ncbi:MAG: SPOR domain-containing protein, partial [Desulfovibrionaceae bacterium]|nr:SPOR domain-containing protein [Desulfovibrionaceae bacterium]
QELTPVKVDYGIYIQLGSYKNPKNAAKVRARLARSGFESRIFKTPEGLFNVQAGPLEDAALEESLASLSQDYPGAFIIKP